MSQQAWKWIQIVIVVLAINVMVAAQSYWAGKGPAKSPAAKTDHSKVSKANQEMSELRAMVAAQQEQLEAQRRQMEQLQSQVQQLLEATRQANAAAEKGQSGAAQAQASAVQAQQAATDAQRVAEQASSSASETKASMALVNSKAQEEDKKLSALSEFAGRFRLGGDVRLRGESYMQGAPGFFDRNRVRIRARFGFDSKLNEDFSAGIFLATGSPADIISSNETLSNFFERKTIGVDRAFIAYQPVKHPWMQLMGGKYAFTWARTSLTFDPDINPEGFSEKFTWNVKNPVVKSFSVGAMQLLYNEVGAGTDSYALGGQVGARLEWGRWTGTPQFVLLKWNNPSAILQASGFAVQATKGTDSGGDTIFLPGEGPGCAPGSAGSGKLPSTPPCAIAANGMTNAVITDSKGVPRFLSGFFYSDYLLNNEFKTNWKRWPVNLLLEFQDNLDAAEHPLDTKGNPIPGLGSQGKGYLVDLSLGQTKSRNDIQFGYTYWRQEQDAILATFSESEARASTNLVEHRFYGMWKVRSNTLAIFNLWRGRTLNTGLQNNAAVVQKTVAHPGDPEPNVNHFQWDLIYTF